jgi:pyruvate dehydrogenase E2 component (dihydrolipoamide acetyltransferase)
MAEIVNMPKLGFDMAEGTLVRWVKKMDEPVAKGDVLAEIETDKATVEVEASAEGFVRKFLVEEGEAVPVGTPIAIIGVQGEQVDDLVPQVEAKPKATSAKGEVKTETAEPSSVTRAVTEQAQSTPDGHLPDGVRASPLARRMAQDHNLDLKQISGSGPQGRIVKDDIEKALEAGVPSQAGRPAILVPTGERRQTERIPLTKLRSAIGRRMGASNQEVPSFFVTADIDAGPVMALRSELNEYIADDFKFSVNDFIVKAAALALRQYPNLNASFDGDAIIHHGAINIGIAVAVENGLLTVVVQDADLKSLKALSLEARQIIERARSNRVRPDDIEGSTFTVSNLGMFDVDNFIAIVNPPEAAILAVGSVRQVPVVQEGKLVIGQRLKVTITADHRVTDGAEAAQWLQAFRSFLEHPVQLLL